MAFRISVRPGILVEADTASDVQELLETLGISLGPRLLEAGPAVVEEPVFRPERRTKKTEAVVEASHNGHSEIAAKVLRALSDHGPLSPRDLETHVRQSRYHLKKTLRELSQRHLVHSTGATTGLLWHLGAKSAGGGAISTRAGGRRRRRAPNIAASKNVSSDEAGEGGRGLKTTIMLALEDGPCTFLELGTRLNVDVHALRFALKRLAHAGVVDRDGSGSAETWCLANQHRPEHPEPITEESDAAADDLDDDLEDVDELDELDGDEERIPLPQPRPIATKPEHRQLQPRKEKPHGTSWWMGAKSRDEFMKEAENRVSQMRVTKEARSVKGLPT